MNAYMVILMFCGSAVADLASSALVLRQLAEHHHKDALSTKDQCRADSLLEVCDRMDRSAHALEECARDIVRRQVSARNGELYPPPASADEAMRGFWRAHPQWRTTNTLIH